MPSGTLREITELRPSRRRSPATPLRPPQVADASRSRASQREKRGERHHQRDDAHSAVDVHFPSCGVAVDGRFRRRWTEKAVHAGIVCACC